MWPNSKEHTKSMMTQGSLSQEPALSLSSLFLLHPVHHKDTAWTSLLGAFIAIVFTNPYDSKDSFRNHVKWDTLLFFAGLFVVVEVCATMGLLQAIGDIIASFIKSQDKAKHL